MKAEGESYTIDSNKDGKEAGIYNSAFRIYGEPRRTIPHSTLSSGVYF
jgi:hypothetical protein